MGITSVDDPGNDLMSGSNYADAGAIYSETAHLTCGKTYKFTINDAYGDGICCSYGEGNYIVTVEGSVVFQGGEFGNTEVKEFAIQEELDPSPTNPPTPSPTNPSTPSPTNPPTPSPTIATTKTPIVSPTLTPVLPVSPPTSQPVSPPVTQPTSGQELSCPSGYSGLYPSPGCAGYFHCSGGVVTSTVILCPANLLFNIGGYCDWDYNVNCQT